MLFSLSQDPQLARQMQDTSTALSNPACHRIPEQRRRVRDWQDRCRTVRLCSPVLRVIGSLSSVEGSVIKQDKCRTVRLCSPVLPIGSLKWQRSFKLQRHRIPEQRRRVRDWQARCRTVRLCSPVLRVTA